MGQSATNVVEMVSQDKAIDNGAVSEDEDVDMNHNEDDETSEAEWLGLD